MIEEFRNIKIAYLRRTGAYGAENQKLMADLKQYLKEHQLFHSTTTILGIPLDNPADTPAEKLRYAIFEIPHTEQDVVSFWSNLPALTAELPVDETKPIIERYSAAKVACHLCEFCVPLKEG